MCQCTGDNGPNHVDIVMRPRVDSGALFTFAHLLFFVYSDYYSFFVWLTTSLNGCTISTQQNIHRPDARVSKGGVMSNIYTINSLGRLEILEVVL